MATNKPVKSQKVAVSKKQLAETAHDMEEAAISVAMDGQDEIVEGAQRMEQAGEISDAGTEIAMEGASDLTRAIDEKIVSERLSVLSEVVGTAGVVDIAEGAAMLAESDDVGVMSALVGMMGEEDLERGLALARIAGELRTAADLLEELKMPVFADFMFDRAEQLQTLSVDQIHASVSTRGFSQLLAASGGRIGELGENEMEEGVTRLVVAGAVADKSDTMGKHAEKLAMKGVEEIIVGGEVRQIAKGEAIEGAKEISDGSAALGAAVAIDGVAQTLKEKSEE